MTETKTPTTLVHGGTGKTGRRVAQRLAALGRPARAGSRSGRPRFDWQDRIADGVRRALGREPRDFAGYTRETAASGVWEVPAVTGADR
jgi:hypothetical protein